MSRFYVDPDAFKEDVVEITGEDFRHLSKALRLTEGDKIEICSFDSQVATGEITNIENGRAIVELSEKRSSDRENKNSRIALFQGVPKKGKLDLITQKATELGAVAVHPFYTKRSVVRPSGSDTRKTERLSRIAYEAAKQCGRGILPEVYAPKSFNEALTALSGFDIVLVCYEDEQGMTLKNFLESLTLSENPIQIALVIGPEGGFDPTEIEKLKEAGAKTVSLGNRILRTETAGLSALSQLNFFFES